MKRQLLQISIAFTLVFSFTHSADALPGESVQTVQNRVKRHSVLVPLKRGVSELSGLPFYMSRGKLPNGNIVFSMSPDRRDRQSQQETIAYGTAKPFVGFTRQNVELIQQMFNSPIAQDFKQSSYVAKVDYNHVEKRFYRGKSFAYATTTFKQANEGQKFYHFTVLSLKDLDGEIQADQQCRQQSANGCE